MEEKEKIEELWKRVDEDYKKLVEEAAKNNEDFLIHNSTVGHAIFVSRWLIDKAEKNIKILTGELTSIYYEHIKQNLEDVIKRIKKPNIIKIIICDTRPEENDDFVIFLNTHSDAIEVRRVSPTEKELLAEKYFKNHFLVSDSRRYRFEKPHTRQDLEQYKVEAVANFGDSERATVLDSFFENIWGAIGKIR